MFRFKERRPPDPLVPHLALECSGRPANEGQPLFAINRNVSNGFPDEGAESEIVVVANEFVPLRPFFPFDGTDFERLKNSQVWRASPSFFFAHGDIV